MWRSFVRIIKIAGMFPATLVALLPMPVLVATMDIALSIRIDIILPMFARSRVQILTFCMVFNIAPNIVGMRINIGSHSNCLESIVVLIGAGVLLSIAVVDVRPGMRAVATRPIPGMMSAMARLVGLGTIIKRITDPTQAKSPAKPGVVRRV